MLNSSVHNINQEQIDEWINTTRDTNPIHQASYNLAIIPGLLIETIALSEIATEFDIAAFTFEFKQINYVNSELHFYYEVKAKEISISITNSKELTVSGLVTIK